MKKRTTWKRICGLLLTLALIVPCLVVPAYAFDGSYTVSGQYLPNNVPLPADTEFELYLVGGFARKADDPAISILQLNDAIKAEGYTGNISLGYKNAGTAEEAEWSDQDWLDEAKTLSDWIVDKKEKFESAKTTTSYGAFSFYGLSNGLYLLRSDDRQRINNGGDGSNEASYYSPVPMFIQVLNGNVTGIGVKAKEENVKAFRVTKIWANDSDKTVLRPSQITIERLYGGEKYDEQVLSDDNNWTFSWEATEEQLEKEWTVREVMDDSTALNYSCATRETIDKEGHLKQITLTNTYSRCYLEIIKNTDKLAKLTDGSNITAVFEVAGFKNNKEIFRRNSGVVIDDTSKKLIVNNIPINLDRLEVTEVYAGGNYSASPGGAKQAEFIAADTADSTSGYYTVSFENKLGDTTVISHGIVNKYQKIGDGVKIVERIGSDAVNKSR